MHAETAVCLTIDEFQWYNLLALYLFVCFEGVFVAQDESYVLQNEFIKIKEDKYSKRN
jgi:hypothetical protein